MKRHLFLSLLALSFSTPLLAAQPLRILIVNDDGCQSEGSVSLHQKLTAKGYDAWLVAPSTNQSGIGSAITFKSNEIFEFEKLGEKHFCFAGTPADAVDFGLRGVLKNMPPDLVISGVNDGPNTGITQLNSGTVGAAVRAVRYGYPALAASIGYLFNDEEIKNGWPSTQKYWPDAVDYVVDLVDTLAKQQKPDTPILPKGSGLSINYPALPKNKIVGVKYITNEFYPMPQIDYTIVAEGKARQTMNADILKPNTADTDTGWLNKGFITYTLFDGDWNAPQFQADYEKRLNTKTLQVPGKKTD